MQIPLPLVIFVLIYHIEASYKCVDTTIGYGANSGYVFIGKTRQMSDCVTACIRQRWSDMYIDGVTYWSGYCYCQRWLKYVVQSHGYQTCTLQYVPNKKQNSKYTCSYQSVDRKGSSTYYVGKTSTKEDCIQACSKKKETDKQINAVTFSTDGKKRCTCKRGLTSFHRSTQYLSCILKLAEEITCPFQAGYTGVSKNFYTGFQQNKDQCLASCLQIKWIDQSINSVTYYTVPSSSLKACYCGRNGRSIYASTEWEACLIRVASAAKFECGKSADSNDDVAKRITGGLISEAHMWPWQVGLFAGEELLCGGTLVSPLIVLTAAHCVSNERYSVKDYNIVIGDHDQNSVEEHQQQIEVSGITLHKDYDSKTFNNDIAILKLAKPITFSNNVFPACLPKQGQAVKPGKQCYTSGWGKVDPTGKTSIFLKHLQLNILTDKTCQEKNGALTHITKNMVCAANLETPEDSSCEGDSGGPLVCQENGKWILQGVVSFGSSECNARDVYPVYTRVSNYIDWMLENMKK